MPIQFAALLFALTTMALASGPGTQRAFRFDPGTRVFRIDGGETTYGFGINGRGELESLYWGGRLLPDDPLPVPPQGELHVFETDSGITPQEYAGWGGGLYVEPALKISFPDGNRGLALRYVSHAITPLDRQITPRHIEIVGNRIHDLQGGGLSSQYADHLLFAKNTSYDTSYRAMYATSRISIRGSHNTGGDTATYTIVIRDNLLYRNRTEVKWAQIKAMSDGNGIIIDSNRNESPKGDPYLGRMLIANNIVHERPAGDRRRLKRSSQPVDSRRD